MKKFRTKTAIILVLVVMLTLMAACQPMFNDTPAYISEIHEEYTKLSVVFDVDVTGPNTITSPVADVQKRIFSDDDLLYFINLLAGKKDEMYSCWDLTKDEWEQKLALVKQYGGTERVTPDLIRYLQNQADNASINVNNPLIHVSELPIGKQSKIYVRGDDNRISVFSFIRKGNTFTYFRDIDSGILGRRIYESCQGRAYSQSAHNHTCL